MQEIDLRGIIPAIVTPMTNDGALDLPALRRYAGWLAEQGLGSRRVTVISRGGAAPWYRHLTTQYVDLLELMTADEFRERTAGPKKQVDTSRDFDSKIVETVQRRLGLEKLDGGNHLPGRSDPRHCPRDDARS